MKTVFHRLPASALVLTLTLPALVAPATARADICDADRIKLRGSGSSDGGALELFLLFGAIAGGGSTGSTKPRPDRDARTADQDQLPEGGRSAESGSGGEYCGTDSHGNPVYYGSAAQ